MNEFAQQRAYYRACHKGDVRQGTETPAEKQNNSSVMVEPCEVATYQHRTPFYSFYRDVADYDALWESAHKCSLGVGWKPSVKHYMNNLPLEILKMVRALEDGTWKNGRPHEIIIPYPRRRQGSAIRFPDRVYQRSMNDNVLYPEMTRHFVIGNCACQKGKGPDFARMLLKKYLWNFYSNYGIDGYILQIDIKSYYPNMRHDKVKNCFRRYIPWDIEKHIEEVLDQQYDGEIGYNPGSQMVQIAGISLLNPLDHYIKERLHARWYIRYMDDFLILGKTREELQKILTVIKERLAALGFSVSEKKTHIKPLSETFRFLGFDYRITKTGKIIMTINPESVKHERRKLYRLIKKVACGETTIQKADECYTAYKAVVKHGNSHQLLAKLDEYYISLKRRAGICPESQLKYSVL